MPFPRIFYESVLWGVGLGPGSGVKNWIFDLQPPTLCPCSKMTHIVCLNMIMLLEYILDSPLGKQFQPSYEPPAEMITRHVGHWHGGHRHWPVLRWRYLRLHRSSRFQLVQGASLWLQWCLATLGGWGDSGPGTTGLGNWDNVPNIWVYYLGKI